MKQSIVQPPIWLLLLIAVLPQIAETIYTPSLPDIAKALRTSDAMVEYTLTIFLAGFSLGVLFWGNLSDRWGRKPCVLMGLGIYILGCVGCFFATSITELMLARLVQSIGGSTGSVMGQSMARDAFQGSARGKVFATVGAAISLSPAIGPVIGGYLDQTYGWASNFLLLILMGLVVFVLSLWRLPETLPAHQKTKNSLWGTACLLAKDSRVLRLGFLVGGCIGMAFTYYGEGSFYLIDLLGLTPSLYGNTFICIAMAGVLGGFLSRKLLTRLDSLRVLGYGIKIVLAGGILFPVLIFALTTAQAPNSLLIGATLGSMMVIVAGNGLIVSNTLALALEDYQSITGTASALFGCFNYALVSLFTFGIGFLHNGTLFPLPFYLCGITVLMWVVFRGLEKAERQRMKVVV